VLILLDLAKKWDFEISLEEAQNLMGEIWKNVSGILRSANLITLAEKLGFNAERFSKITGPNNSAS